MGAEVYGLAISPDEGILVGVSYKGLMKKWNISIIPVGYIINQDGGGMIIKKLWFIIIILVVLNNENDIKMEDFIGSNIKSKIWWRWYRNRNE